MRHSTPADSFMYNTQAFRALNELITCECITSYHFQMYTSLLSRVVTTPGHQTPLSSA